MDGVIGRILFNEIWNSYYIVDTCLHVCMNNYLFKAKIFSLTDKSSPYRPHTHEFNITIENDADLYTSMENQKDIYFLTEKESLRFRLIGKDKIKNGHNK